MFSLLSSTCWWHAQCLDALLKTAMSPRVPLPLRTPACAGLIDGFFMHAAGLADGAWAQLTELLDFLLLRRVSRLPGPTLCLSWMAKLLSLNMHASCQETCMHAYSDHFAGEKRLHGRMQPARPKPPLHACLNRKRRDGAALSWREAPACMAPCNQRV
jgi:hypothetical protein